MSLSLKFILRNKISFSDSVQIKNFICIMKLSYYRIHFSLLINTCKIGSLFIKHIWYINIIRYETIVKKRTVYRCDISGDLCWKKKKTKTGRINQSVKPRQAKDKKTLASFRHRKLPNFSKLLLNLNILSKSILILWTVHFILPPIRGFRT